MQIKNVKVDFVLKKEHKMGIFFKVCVGIFGCNLKKYMLSWEQIV